MWAQRHCGYPRVVRGAELGKYSLGQGEMSEWFKERAWKVRIPQKGIGGSNPPLSAKKGVNQVVTRFTPFFTPKNRG